MVITISLKRDPSTACKVAWHHVPTSLHVDSPTIKTRHFSLEAVSTIHSFPLSSSAVSLLTAPLPLLFFSFFFVILSHLFSARDGQVLHSTKSPGLEKERKTEKEREGRRSQKRKRPLNKSYHSRATK